MSAPFNHGPDVVGIPQRAPAGDALHPIEAQPCLSNGAARTLERGEDPHGIRLAAGTYTGIAREHTVADIPWICTQTPLVHAIVRAECTSPLGNNLEIAPAAERQPIGSASQGRRYYPPSRHGARNRRSETRDSVRHKAIDGLTRP
ncbi:MAG: hypothetical protein ACRYGF_06340 [Janthinobacterium lividum]